IKSNAGRGGLVQDVIYDDVCIRNTKNPVIFDLLYTMTAADRRASPHPPALKDILLKNVRVLSPGAPILRGVADPNTLVLSGALFNAPLATCAEKFAPVP